jgi:hypothetical protein
MVAGDVRSSSAWARPVAAGDRVTQRPTEPVEHRRVQQEFPDRVGLMRQHFLDQVVDDVAVVAGEPGDE